MRGCPTTETRFIYKSGDNIGQLQARPDSPIQFAAEPPFFLSLDSCLILPIVTRYLPEAAGAIWFLIHIQ